MSVQNENAVSGGETLVRERSMDSGVYASLFEKINLTPATGLSDLSIWQDEAAMAEADANERITAGVKVFLERLRQSGQKVDKLDKTLIDHHIAELDYQISRQLDVVMHHVEFQKVESLWRGLKHLVDNTDYRQNVKTEILDISKDDLRQDFEDAPEIIQSGLYTHTYVAEYDTPGGEPIAAVISAYEFDASAQDVALMRNISKVSAAAHMPFIGSAGPKFFNKTSMEEVAAIKDIGNYFDRAEYIKWKSFRDTDDSRYLGLVMPRVLGRLPYGPDTRLAQLPAGWNITYGNQLVQQVLALWPAQSVSLRQQWQQQLDAIALPSESLTGWHQGMEQLQRLTDRLNGLDEQHGKYMTVSELKSQVFSLTQAFSQTPPVEEQLRQMQQSGVSPALAQQAQMHLNQLLTRYTLLTDKPGNTPP